MAIVAVCAVLMILGVSELVRLLVFWWTKPLTDKQFSVVVTPKSAEECEAVVRAAAERMRWLDMKGGYKLVCVNRSNDGEIDRICRYLMLRYPFLRVSKTEDLVYYCIDEKTEE